MSAKITEHSDHGLPISDRCDGCGAQAYVVVLLENGTTMLCANHAHRGWDKLVATAGAIIDHRPFLLKEAGQRAGAAH